MTVQRRGVLLNTSDDVAVIVGSAPLRPGERVEGVAALEHISSGHKMAIRALPAGTPLRKFGHVFAVASKDIAAGEWVHAHNVAMPPPDGLSSAQDHARASPARDVPDFFMGYPRSNGDAGTRNVVLVAASVNCSASVVKAVCRSFESDDVRRQLAARGVDRIAPLTHGGGCAQTIGGASFAVLNRTLAGSIFHPNVVGTVIIGLGCEGTTASTIFAAADAMGLAQSIPVELVGIQECGGTAAAVAAGRQAVERVLAATPVFTRTPVPAAKLRLALNCGGSDAFSSITANPALGMVSDLLVARGGAVALAEIPECYGTEALLSRRAVSPAVAADLRRLFSWGDDYAARNGAELNNTLSPGNMAGGTPTISEKSLGAVTKAGASPLTAVVDYAAPIREAGFVLMNTPGFDPVSVTGLVAGGCNIVAFTTGRGSVYGGAIAPTLKIATNSDLFRRMNGDMDFDAGRILSGEDIEDVATELYRNMIKFASGELTKSELLGLGSEEFVPWTVGETL